MRVAMGVQHALHAQLCALRMAVQSLAGGWCLCGLHGGSMRRTLAAVIARRGYQQSCPEGACQLRKMVNLLSITQQQGMPMCAHVYGACLQWTEQRRCSRPRRHRGGWCSLIHVYKRHLGSLQSVLSVTLSTPGWPLRACATCARYSARLAWYLRHSTSRKHSLKMQGKAGAARRRAWCFL
jgi:hypothetical protein